MQQIIQFLKEVRTEFHNISWPKRESLIQLTFVVISISLIISLILGGMDYIFTKSIGLIGRQDATNSAQPITTVAPEVTVAPTINLASPIPTKKK